MENVRPFDEEAAMREQNLPRFALYLYIDYFEDNLIHPLIAKIA